MRFQQFRSAVACVALIATAFCLLALATVRDERLMMAAYYQQKQAESLNAATKEDHVADLAEGKAHSAVLPFLNPIGEPGPHRVAATEHEARAIQYGRIGWAYRDAAARPWRSVDISGVSP
jgi:hypothetical protein